MHTAIQVVLLTIEIQFSNSKVCILTPNKAALVKHTAASVIRQPQSLHTHPLVALNSYA